MKRKHILIFILVLLVNFSLFSQGTSYSDDDTQTSTSRSNSEAQSGGTDAGTSQTRQRRSANVNRRAGGYYSAGKRAYKKGNYLKAVKWLKRAISLNGSKAKYHYYLGRALYRLKRYQDSLDAFNKAMQLDNNMNFTTKPDKYKRLYNHTKELAQRYGNDRGARLLEDREYSNNSERHYSQNRDNEDYGMEEGNRGRKKTSIWNILGFVLLGLAVLLLLIFMFKKKNKSY